jgi:hypothetical protein
VGGRGVNHVKKFSKILSGNDSSRGKIAFLRLFASIHKPLLNQGSVFSR